MSDQGNGAGTALEVAEDAELALEFHNDAVAVVVRQMETIDRIVREIMVEETDYGRIPGCKKLSLWQPGAEKLALAFRMRTKFDEAIIDNPDGHKGHREVQVTCHLYAQNGDLLTQGHGSCSTLESKYRWRSGIPCPECGEPLRESKKKQGEWYCWKKTGGCGHKGPKPSGAGEERRENPDVADEWHTVRAMAVKRAMVLAVKRALAASDRFTEQDLPPASDMPPDDFEPRAAVSRTRPVYVDTREAGRQIEAVRRRAGISPDDINGWLRKAGLDFRRMEQKNLDDLLAWIRSGPAADPPPASGDDPIGEMMADLGAAGDPQPKATLEEFAGGSLAALDEDATKRLQEKVAKHLKETESEATA
jgi:hypothetical protein